jgi:hypothetical protein
VEYTSTPRNTFMACRATDSPLFQIKRCFSAPKLPSNLIFNESWAYSVLRLASGWTAWGSNPVQRGPGAHPASSTIGTGLFPGVKRPGRCVDHPPPSNVEVKESLELYLYFLYAFMDCSRVNWGSFTRDKDTGNLKLISVQQV